MKKIIAMLLALTMVLALAACGGDPKETTPGNDPIQQTTPVENQGNDPVETEPQVQNPTKEELTVEYLKSLPETPVEDFEVGRGSDGVGYCILAYVGDSDVVVIPAEIEGRPVTELAKGVFDNDSAVRGVLIPESVKEIGELFVNSTAVELVVAEGLEVVGYGAFTNSSVREVKLGDNVLAMDVTAFGACGKLEKVYIPASLTDMTSDEVRMAFSACKNLTIYGEAGSFIEGVANELGIPFVAE